MLSIFSIQHLALHIIARDTGKTLEIANDQAVDRALVQAKFRVSGEVIWALALRITLNMQRSAMSVSRLLSVCGIAGIVFSAGVLSINAQAPARVTGVLIELNKPGTIEVTVSVGADDGVRAGDTLNVVRNGQVCGKLEVTKTHATRSIAKIIEVSPGKALAENDATNTP